MSDFASTLAGLGDALGALAKRAEEIDQNLSRQFAELEGQTAAMRAVLERIGFDDGDAAALWADVNRALAGDAGKGWVSPERHANELKMTRLRVLNEISTSVASRYGRTGGTGINAAQVYVDILDLLAQAAKQ